MKAIERWRVRQPHWFANAVMNFPPGDGEGWSDIVDELLQRIDARLQRWSPDHFQIRQIKEKTGSLRLYFMLNEEDAALRLKISNLIEEARLKTVRTCMICGVAGEISRAPGCMLLMDSGLCPNRLASVPL